MCARYDLHHNFHFLRMVLTQLRARAAAQGTPQGEIEFPADPDEDLTPNYNAAPTNLLPVIVNKAGTWVLEMMELGLVPAWTQDLSKCIRPVNARDDGVLTRPYFKHAIIHHRCLVPMSGYFEWQKAGKNGKDRLPFYIHRKDQQPFYVAGLWERWKSPQGELKTFCTMTVPANDLILSIPHPRMLAVLSPEEAELWMDPDTLAPEAVALLKPYSGEDFTMHRVTTRVNKVDFNELACIEKVSDEEAAKLPSEQRGIENQRRKDAETGQENLFDDI